MKITKTFEFIWRVPHIGDSYMGHVRCWNVVDVSGSVVLGGSKKGSNVFSGRAYVNRKKDCNAFVDGFNAAKSGDYEYQHRGQRDVVVESQPKIKANRSDLSDHDAMDYWLYGFEHYLNYMRNENAEPA